MGKIFCNLQCYSVLQRIDNDHVAVPQRYGLLHYVNVERSFSVMQPQT